MFISVRVLEIILELSLTIPLVMGLRDNFTLSGESISLLFETLAHQMNLTSLLDLPLLSLSNG